MIVEDKLVAKASERIRGRRWTPIVTDGVVETLANVPLGHCQYCEADLFEIDELRSRICGPCRRDDVDELAGCY